MPVRSDVTRVAVFGGTGFLGRRIVARLADAGLGVRVAARHPEGAAQAADVAGAGEPVYADVRDETSVALALDGCDGAVNAVGLYVEHGAESFEAVHELGAMNVAHQCAVRGIGRLVHVSGIGADVYAKSHYVRARAKGELMVRDTCAAATILRPSVLFATDDRFVNALADIARITPVLPLFGRGETRLQPVHADDVAAAVVAALRHPEAPGETYELGGPDVFTYRGLIEGILRRAGRRRVLLPVPFAIWDLLAAIASLLPRPPLTAAQVELMKRDNVVADDARSFAELGIDPIPLGEILPAYEFAAGR